MHGMGSMRGCGGACMIAGGVCTFELLTKSDLHNRFFNITVSWGASVVVGGVHGCTGGHAYQSVKTCFEELQPTCPGTTVEGVCLESSQVMQYGYYIMHWIQGHSERVPVAQGGGNHGI